MKVIFSGPANVSATVFDHGNGSYEAIALLVDPGYYTVIATIERSLCEGYREPKPSFYPSCKCVPIIYDWGGGGDGNKILMRKKLGQKKLDQAKGWVE